MTAATKRPMHLCDDHRVAIGHMLLTLCGRWIKGVAQSKPRAIVWDCVGDPKLATCDECRRKSGERLA